MSKRLVMFSLAILVGTLPGSAQKPDCDSANTQMDMNTCASEKATQADKELNAVYSALLKKVAGDKVAVAAIVAAERAWMGFRNADLESMWPAADKQRQYGSMYPMEYALAYAALTQQRTKELRDQLAEAGDH